METLINIIAAIFVIASLWPIVIVVLAAWHAVVAAFKGWSKNTRDET